MNVLKSIITVGLCLLPGLGSTADNSKNQLVIVLDASNSMWGQIEGRHKIDIARNSLTSLLQMHGEPADAVTLITYGSQRKSDCNDIKTLSADSTDALLRQIAGINPKGRSPISAALTQAADAGQKILLISDGQESCNTDPCATALELKASHPDLQINVLGFHADPASDLHCIADNTGGRFALASNTEVLASLLAPQSTSAVVKDTPDLPPDTSGTLELTLGAGDDLTNLPGSFLLYDENNEHISSFTARQEVSQTLAPGKYRVDALWKQMKLSTQLTVSPGQTTTHRFNIGGMGQLALEAMDNEHNPVNANFTIYTRDGDYLSDALLKSRVNEQLPAGNYRIHAEFGGQQLETLLEIKTGEEAHHTFMFDLSTPK